MIRLLAVCLLIIAVCGLGSALAADSPLADAAEARNGAKVRELLAQKVDAKIPQPDGMTALHWAALYGDARLTGELLAAGAEAGAVSRYGVTPLALACSAGNAAVTEQLLNAGADPNQSLNGGETPLMIAARNGRPEPVKALLAKGAKIDAREHKQQTALMWAAAEGHLEVVEVLLASGADFRTPLVSGFTPFFFAVREGKDAVVVRLLSAGIDVNATMQPERRGGTARGRATTALLLAVENGHFELASKLLTAGADPNAHPAGFTALHALTWVRKPIRGDGDPPPRGSGRLDSLTFTRQLIAAGAKLDARLEHGASGRGRFTTTGSTPFLMAARNCDMPLMKLLIEQGANPTIPNTDNSSPLLAAAGVGALGDGDEAAGTEQEAVEAARLLLDLGADINAVDANGETAMHGAAYQSRADLVHLLAERGADVKIWDRKNKWGWTPLMIAQGHRPGNFRPAPETIVAIEKVMRAAGVEPPPPIPADNRPQYK